MASYSRPVVTTEHGVPAVAAAGGAPASRPAAAWRTRLGEAAFPLGVFAVVAVVLYAVAEIAFTGWRPPIPGHGFPDYRGFEAFTRWDSDWYLRIARIGYYYDGPHKQSAVNFFPGYPAMIRLVRTVLRNYIVAGVVVTYLSGAAAVVLLHRWCSGAFGSRAAKMAVLLLALYPFAFYLFGTVYSDALFLAAALGAFVLLEADHPWLAGAVGALAVATRPAGPAVVIGLTIRALELRGVLGGAPGHFLRGGEPAAAGHRTPFFPRLRLRRLNWRDAGVLLSVLGLVAFCLLLWHDFREPFAFAKVSGVEGWGRRWDAHTLLKIDFYDRLQGTPHFGFIHIYLGAQALFTVIGVALIPLVIRRLGWGYGAYTATAILMPAIPSANFLGMGRYILAAFPCFAVVAAALAGGLTPGKTRRPRIRVRAGAAWLAISGALLGFMMTLYARWWFIT